MIPPDLSPFEKNIYQVREKLIGRGCPAPVESSVIGPNDFMDSVLEIDEVLLKAIGGDVSNTSLVGCLVAGDLNLKHLLHANSPALDNPFRIVQELFIRAFQSTKSRKYLRHFVMAITDGRLDKTPVNLSKISPEWCDRKHELYARCWAGLKSSTPDSTATAPQSNTVDLTSKVCQSEAALGRTVAHSVITNAKLKDRMLKRICQEIMRDEYSMVFIGRIIRFSRNNGTDELMKSVVANIKGIADSNKCDMPKLVRAIMSTANAHGVDVSAGTGKITSLLKNFT